MKKYLICIPAAIASVLLPAAAFAQTISIGTGATTGLVTNAAAGGGYAFTNLLYVLGTMMGLILFLVGLGWGYRIGRHAVSKVFNPSGR